MSLYVLQYHGHAGEGPHDCLIGLRMILKLNLVATDFLQFFW